jgi:hypothetical protein
MLRAGHNHPDTVLLQYITQDTPDLTPGVGDLPGGLAGASAQMGAHFGVV